MSGGDTKYPLRKGHLVQYVIPGVRRDIGPRSYHGVEVGAVGIVFEQDGYNHKVFFRPGVNLWFNIGEIKRLGYP